MAILWAGLACAVTDITAAFVVYSFFGATPVRILQGIAAGLLGSRAFNGGLATAALGLACHFCVATSAAAAYFGLSRLVPALVERTVPAGMLYGVAVYFFMERVVVPLSAAPKRRHSLKLMTIGIAIHMLCVGLPIAIVVRRFSG
jgi:hypothetical protein